MEARGIVRDIDSMGRVVIPKEIRKQLNIESNVDSVEIFIQDDCIILRKHSPACFLCNKMDELVKYNGHKICVNCIDKLKELKDQL